MANSASRNAGAEGEQHDKHSSSSSAIAQLIDGDGDHCCRSLVDLFLAMANSIGRNAGAEGKHPSSSRKYVFDQVFDHQQDLSSIFDEKYGCLDDIMHQMVFAVELPYMQHMCSTHLKYSMENPVSRLKLI